MSEDVNMYSNVLNFVVVYLRLYSTKIGGEEETFTLFVSVSILCSAKIIILVFLLSCIF